MHNEEIYVIKSGYEKDIAAYKEILGRKDNEIANIS